MVTMSVPSTALTGVTHERAALPSMCTVQAPHMPMPHPNFVPVRPASSRITQSSGVSASASTVTWLSIELEAGHCLTPPILATAWRARDVGAIGAGWCFCSLSFSRQGSPVQQIALELATYNAGRIASRDVASTRRLQTGFYRRYTCELNPSRI